MTSGLTRELPMFPLGSVLFPGLPLPLRIFEDRYRTMIRACLDADRLFGVVLIERGSEVGGGDVRSSAGTVAEIAEATEFADGRWAVLAVGQRELTVLEWMHDAPYPRAVVRLDTEPVGTQAGPTHLAAPLTRAEVAVRAALQAAVDHAPEHGAASFNSDDLVFAEPALLRLNQLCAVVPLGTYDKQLLLRAPGPIERAVLLAELADEHVATLEGRIGP